MLLLFSQGEIGITGNRPALKAIRGSNGDFLLTDNTGGGHAIYSAAIHSYPTDGRILLAKFCVTAKYTADDFTVIDEVAGAGDILNSTIVGYTISDDAVLEYAVICDTPFYCIVFKISSVPIFNCHGFVQFFGLHTAVISPAIIRATEIRTEAINR